MTFYLKNINTLQLKIIFRLIILIFFVQKLPVETNAQTPTIQDCAGAIPICKNIYSETNSYIGFGNYPNEIDSLTSCCTAGEKNSVWYTFTAQTSGNLSFIITPKNTTGLGDDYDWSVFNLTNATCADIYNDPSLEISCNSWGSYTQPCGATGASTANGGIGNSNGPGDTNGPPFNSDIPVTAGNTYVMMVSNVYGSTHGYTLDFSSSTAQIFDNVPPKIKSIFSAISCGATSITFNFSENILCSTIAPCDLSITGPGGTYTVTSVAGINCAAGGTEEKTFTIAFNPPIKISGNYSLNLNAASCNSVTDLCGNAAPSGSLPFTVNLFNVTDSVKPASCTSSDGMAAVFISGGAGNYTYKWNTNPTQTTSIATNLSSGNYIVTISDGNCTSFDTIYVPMIIDFSISTNIVNSSCGMPNGSATVIVNNGTQPYSYNWSTSPTQTTATASNLSAQDYTVTVSDASGCSMTSTISILAANALAATISNVDAHCNQADGSATVVASGGTGNYTYIWNTAKTTSTIQNLTPGTYTVTVNDGFCDTIANTTIANLSASQAEFTYNPEVITIKNPDVTFTSTSSDIVSWEWDFGDGSGLFYGETIVHDYDSIGIYNATLITTDNFGCIDTISEPIVINDKFTVFIPNCFTPNGNGINDVFQAKGNSWISGSFEMKIFDRWGNIIYQTDDPAKSWNGGNNNDADKTKIISGVYIYQIKVKGIDCDEKTFTGTVTLMK